MRGKERGKLWEGRRKQIDPKRVVLNYIKRKGATLPPVFENTGICMACGKEKHVNVFGMCESCWVTHAHLRGGKIRNGK